jgi:Asp-tRNA(Asn)/Glu-tRNA(Gln) amidotransferase A subunit family amidase
MTQSTELPKSMYPRTASHPRKHQSLESYGFKKMFTLTSRFLYKFSGCPAITIPIKLSEQGLPLSLQLMAENYKEGLLLAVAKWIENVVNFPCLQLET